jgi:hypothetical protein
LTAVIVVIAAAVAAYLLAPLLRRSGHRRPDHSAGR